MNNLLSESIEFTVYGTAKPAGSKRPFIYKQKGTGKQKVAMTDACGKSQDWKGSVMTAACVAYDGPLILGPVRFEVTFYFTRPNNHYGTGRNEGVLKASSPEHKITTPDLTKLVRGTEDALKGIIWKDDSQVVEQDPRKVFCKLGEKPRAEIRIIEL